MKIVRYCVLFIVGMFALPFIANAECSYERQAELSRIAGNVQFNYEYDVNQELKFAITLSNLTNDIYIVDSENSVFTSSSNLSKRYHSSDTITYSIYANDTNCYGELITKRYVSLPTYNYLHDSDMCENNLDLKQCQLWGNYSTDDLYTEIENKENKNSNIDDITSKNDNDIFWVLKIMFLLMLMLILIWIIIHFKKVKVIK